MTKLTIGMAVHDDYDGIVMTIQPLRAHCDVQGGQYEFLVVDNNPNSAHGQATAKFCRNVNRTVPCRYLPSPEVVGTAAPRDKVMREAAGKYVVCIDAHVILDRYAVNRLLGYFDRNHETNDLIQGPLLYDDLYQTSTHFDGTWSAEMWGVWQDAWRCRCGVGLFHTFFEAYRDGRPPLLRFADLWGTVIPACQACGGEFPSLGNNMAAMNQHGFSRAAADVEGDPFPIPAQGLGAFACRKDAWLGFNPRFRGFGGEEHYIHEKYRQAGRQALCLPGFRWWHRFDRPGGARYPLSRAAKVRNYMLGHRELGVSLDRCRSHFVDQLGTPASEWDALLHNVDNNVDPPDPVVAPATTVAGKAACGQCQEAAADQNWLKVRLDSDPAAALVKEYADKSESVVEFQDARGVSTAVIMSSKAARFLSNTRDIPGRLVGHKSRTPSGQMMTLGNLHGHDAEPEPHDTLFVGDGHADDAYRSLVKHHMACRKWLIVNGGETWRQGPGPLPGLRKFLREFPQWTVIRSAKDVLVLSKDDADKQQLPPLWKQGWSFLNAVVKDATNGFGNAPLDVVESRLKICTTCPLRNGTACGKCGCDIERKASYPRDQCPVGHWHPV